MVLAADPFCYRLTGSWLAIAHKGIALSVHSSIQAAQQFADLRAYRVCFLGPQLEAGLLRRNQHMHGLCWLTHE